MATIDDVGVPGQPATNLTAWQAAVRDAIKALPLVQGGIVSTAPSGIVNVTFPTPYAAPPAVVVSAAMGAATGIGASIVAGTITATGFQAKAWDYAGVVTPAWELTWTAVGARP